MNECLPKAGNGGGGIKDESLTDDEAAGDWTKAVGDGARPPGDGINALFVPGFGGVAAVIFEGVGGSELF